MTNNRFNTYRTLLKNELKMSFRGMDMLIFAVIMPLVVLVILGLVFGQKPAFEGAPYTFLEQSFGALCTISICAGGVMGLPLVISDYRAKHILKRYQVTPVSPSLVLAVEVSMYALYALASLVSLFIVAFCFFGFRMKGSLALFLAGYFLVMLTMFSIGMMAGGVSKNPKTAGIIASLLYFPMLIFSGATLPYEVMPPALQHVADIMPLTQGVKLMKNAALGLPIENAAVPVAVMVILAVICVVVSIRFFRWE